MLSLLFAALLQDDRLDRIKADLEKLKVEVEEAAKIEDPELRRETLQKLNDRIKMANEALQALDPGPQEKKPELPPQVRLEEPRFRIGTGGNYQYLTHPISAGTFDSFGAGLYGSYCFAENPGQFDVRLSISSLVNFERGQNVTTCLNFCPAVVWRFLDESFSFAVAHPYIGAGLGIDIIWQSNVTIGGTPVTRTADPSVGPDFIAGLAVDVSDSVQFFFEFQFKARFDSILTATSAASTATGRENFSGIFLMLGATYRI